MSLRRVVLSLPFLLLLAMIVVAAQTPVDRLRSGKGHAERGAWKEAEEELRLYRRAHPDSDEAAVLHAVALLRLGHKFDAVIELEHYLARRPASVPVLKLYADLLRKVVADRTAAEETLVKITGLAPRDVEAWADLGNSYLARNNYSEAVRAYERALALSPASPVLMASLGYAAGRAGDMARAASEFSRALRLNERSKRPELLVPLLYARHLLDEGRAAESLPFFTKALLINPHLSEVYYWRAVAYERLRDYRRAELDALAAIREEEERRDAYHLLLRLHRVQRNAEQVKKYVAIVERLAAEESAREETARKVRLALAAAEPLLREGKYAGAATHYEEIVKVLPSFYEAHFALGMCYFQTGRIVEAEASFLKYLALQPLSPDGNAALGIALVQQGRAAEAKPRLLRALELDPSLNEARKALAQAHLSAFDPASAARELEKLLSAGASACDAECYLLLAKARILLDERERAAEICNQGLKLYGDSPAYLKGLAALLLETNAQQPQTEQVVRKVAALLPRDPEARYLVAEWTYLNSQPERCLEELTAALELRPDETTRMRIAALLGAAEEKLERFDRAERAFLISWELNRRAPVHDARAALPYVIFLAHRGRDEEARRVLDQILQWAPTSGAAHFERAKLLGRRGETAQAVEAAKLAVQYLGGDADRLRAAHVFLVRNYFALGRADEARAHQRWLQSRQ